MPRPPRGRRRRRARGSDARYHFHLIRPPPAMLSSLS
uniref:Uncharacterized protein n=1 Tax=Arundo donax TaxID=35708 RepID=A0A0A9BL36_ARUDO